ncbi:MAG: hypothetical protein HC830_04195 [Bacteroidetes bacterium]|nr:hypothetical protein [Bacteroidota bacterium]
MAADLSLKMIRNEKTDVLNQTINNGFKDIPAHLLVTIPVDSTNLRNTVIADGFIKESDVYGDK